MARKTYSGHHRFHDDGFFTEHAPVMYDNEAQYLETSYVYYKTDDVFDYERGVSKNGGFTKKYGFAQNGEIYGFSPKNNDPAARNNAFNNNSDNTRRSIDFLQKNTNFAKNTDLLHKSSDFFRNEVFQRPRTLSFSESQGNGVRNGRSIRDRNRRRQSYNPKAYESSSSDSDCISVGSVDCEWRRRRRLSRLSASNSSIRSEMCKRTVISTNPFLKPNFPIKMAGRSPPPSNSVLSGLSPTSAARCQLRSTNSSSSDSSL